MDYVNFLITSGNVAEWYLMETLRYERAQANTAFDEPGCCRRLCGSVFRTIFYHLGKTKARAAAEIFDRSRRYLF